MIPDRMCVLYLDILENYPFRIYGIKDLFHFDEVLDKLYMTLEMTLYFTFV